MAVTARTIQGIKERVERAIQDLQDAESPAQVAEIVDRNLRPALDDLEYAQSVAD